MSLWNFLMYRSEQKTIQKALGNRTKVLEMIDSSFTIMGNTDLQEKLMSKVDADMKAIMDYCKSQL